MQGHRTAAIAAGIYLPCCALREQIKCRLSTSYFGVKGFVRFLSTGRVSRSIPGSESGVPSRILGVLVIGQST